MIGTMLRYTASLLRERARETRNYGPRNSRNPIRTDDYAAFFPKGSSRGEPFESHAATFPVPCTGHDRNISRCVRGARVHGNDPRGSLFVARGFDEE